MLAYHDSRSFCGHKDLDFPFPKTFHNALSSARGTECMEVAHLVAKAARQPGGNFAAPSWVEITEFVKTMLLIMSSGEEEWNYWELV